MKYTYRDEELTRGTTLIGFIQSPALQGTGLISDTCFLITEEEFRQRLPRSSRIGLYLPGPFHILSSAKLPLSLARCDSFVYCVLFLIIDDMTIYILKL